MKLIRKLTLGKRLALGFGSMLALLGVVVGISITRLAHQDHAMQAVIGESYAKVEASQTVSNLVLDIARIARNLILLTDKEAEARNMAAYEKDRAAIDTNMATLDNLISSPDGREMMAKVKSAGEAYFTFTTEVLDAGRNASPEVATALLFGPKYASQAAYLKALADLVKLERQKMVIAGDDASQTYHSAVATMVAALAAAFAIGGAFAFVITRSITRPMEEAVRIASAVADGDLTSHIDVDATDEVGQLLAVLKTMNGNLAGMVGAVRESSESIATGSEQIATGNADLSQRTEEQAANLQQTAASMEQMQSTVKQNADTARTVSQLAASASAVALRGGEVVAQVVSTMGNISASSHKIADIVGVIDGIAFQTNILALNAAVEAARAGEQGRGFAVVAGEVRSLAQRSAESAREIKKLIAEGVEAVESGTRLVGGAGTTMSDIVDQVRRVADLIGEIDSATQEQTLGIDQVSGAVAQLDQVTQQNAALVEESAAAADSLKQQAIKMSELVKVFKVGTHTVGSKVSAGGIAAAKPLAAAPALRKAPTTAPAARPPAAKPAIAVRVKPTTAATTTEPDWETF